MEERRATDSRVSEPRVYLPYFEAEPLPSWVPAAAGLTLFGLLMLVLCFAGSC